MLGSCWERDISSTGRKILSCCFSLKLGSSTVGWQPGTVGFWLCIWFSYNFSFNCPVWLYIHVVTELKLVKTETLSSKIRKRSHFKTRWTLLCGLVSRLECVVSLLLDCVLVISLNLAECRECVRFVWEFCGLIFLVLQQLSWRLSLIKPFFICQSWFYIFSFLFFLKPHYILI